MTKDLARMREERYRDDQRAAAWIAERAQMELEKAQAEKERQDLQHRLKAAKQAMENRVAVRGERPPPNRVRGPRAVRKSARGPVLCAHPLGHLRRRVWGAADLLCGGTAVAMSWLVFVGGCWCGFRGGDGRA